MTRFRSFLTVLLLALALGAGEAQAQAATHVVRPGETLFSIARQYSLTVGELRALNNLSGDTIRSGQRLRVRGTAAALPRSEGPNGEATRSEDPPPQAEPTRPALPRVEPLPPQNRPVRDARGFFRQTDPPPDITRPDPIAASPPPPPPPPSLPNVRLGRDGLQPFPTDAPREQTEAAGTHVVQRGETLSRIAERYGTTVEALRRANALSGDDLSVGQTLAVPGGGLPNISFAVTRTTLPDDEVHVVRRGETLFTIAARYGTTAGRILALNTLSSRPLAPGTVIGLPDGVGKRYYREPAPPRPADEQGLALVYPASYVGRTTISREPYDPAALTASHRTLPFGTMLWVRAEDTGRETLVRINDRGPVSEGFLIEVSDAAARALGLEAGSAGRVEVRVMR